MVLLANTASKMVRKRNGRTDCHVDAKDLLAKLSSLKEQSYKQFSDIIDCYSSSISDGIRDLTDEVSDLQSELSLMRKEKSVLLETVDNLNGEIRQLNAKSQSLAQPVEEQGKKSLMEIHLKQQKSII